LAFPARWAAKRANAAARLKKTLEQVVVGGRRIALGISAVVFSSMLVTAIIQRDAAGALAVAGAAFLIALALDFCGLRKFVPGVGGRGWPGAVTTFVFYLVTVSIVYGVAAGAFVKALPPGPGPEPSAEFEADGRIGRAASRPPLSVVSDEEPAFMASVVAATAPSTVILDGDEPVELAGVPYLSTSDPAYWPALKALQGLVVGRTVAVTVEAASFHPFPANPPQRLTVFLSVKLENGQRVAVNDAVLRVIRRIRGAAADPGPRSCDIIRPSV